MNSAATDADTTIAALRAAMKEFVAQRAWERFHSPKNLAMSVAIEAAELMETVQWLSVEESWTLRDDPLRHAAAEEIADVFCYLLALANVLDLDLTTTVLEKLEKNRRKYPVEDFRGRFGANDPSPPQPAP